MSQSFPCVELDLILNGGIAVFPSSFISLCFVKHIEAFIMLGDCKSDIFPPQEPERLENGVR